MDDEMERMFEALQEKHAEDYKKLSTEICLENELGTMVAQSLIKRELNRLEALAGNASTVSLYINEWVTHFKENLVRGYIPNEVRYFADDVRIKNSAIIVGAGPSLTDEQIEALQYYKGTIICTNKSLKRLLEHDIIPTIVPVVHSTDEIVPHFDNDEVQEKGNLTKYLLCSNVHPRIPELLYQVGCSEKNVYWFHAYVPEDLVPNFNTMFDTFTHLPTIDTGGNVGLMSIQVAQHCGAKTLGFIGMEHCVPLSKEWSNAEAQDYNIVYAPEDDLLFALTPVMRNYLQVLNTWYQENKNVFDIYNLTPNGLFYVRRHMKNKTMPYLPLGDFIRRYD